MGTICNFDERINVELTFDPTKIDDNFSLMDALMSACDCVGVYKLYMVCVVVMV